MVKTFVNISLIANKLKLSSVLIVNYLVNGIENYTVRIQVAGQNFSEPCQLLNYMLKLCMSIPKDKVVCDKKVKSMDKSEWKFVDSSTEKSEKVRCYNCCKFGHKSPDCKEPKRKKNSCFKCGEEGHLPWA